MRSNRIAFNPSGNGQLRAFPVAAQMMKGKEVIEGEGV